MSVKVIVPSKQFNKKYMGVQFENGVGIFEDVTLGKNIAKVLGYEVEDIVEPVIEPVIEPKAEPVKKAPAKKAPAKKKEE